MFDLASHSQHTGYSEVWRGWVRSLDVNGMLAQSFDAMPVGALKSRIEQNKLGARGPAGEQFWTRMVIGYYMNTLIYPKLYWDKDGKRRYWEAVISESDKGFQTYAMHTCDDMKDSYRKSCHAPIGSAEPNSLPITNDPWYLAGDRNRRMMREAYS